MGKFTDYSINVIASGVNKSQAIKVFADYLMKRNTPYDIFDNLVITDISTQYAPCYVCELHFDFNWLAKIVQTTTVQGTSSYSPVSESYIQNEIEAYKRGWLQGAYGDHGDTREYNYQSTSDYFDRGNSSDFINHIFPAQSGYLREIDDSFFPNADDAIKNIQFYLEESQNEELLFMNENSLSFEEAVTEAVLEEEINKAIRNYISSVYGSNEYTIQNAEYSITKKVCESILCPIYIISYVYNNKNYRAFINGHNFGQKTLFSKTMGIVCGELPKEEADTPKRLFAKIKAEKNKKEHKQQARIEAEAKWLSMYVE